MKYGYDSPLLGLRTEDALKMLRNAGITAEIVHSEAPPRRFATEAPLTQRVVRAEGTEEKAVLTVCDFPDGVSAI